MVAEQRCSAASLVSSSFVEETNRIFSSVGSDVKRREWSRPRTQREVVAEGGVGKSAHNAPSLSLLNQV